MKIKSNAKVVFYLVYNEELYNEIVDTRWKIVKIEPDCMAIEIPPNELEDLSQGLSEDVVVIEVSTKPFKRALEMSIEAQEQMERMKKEASTFWGKFKSVFG